MAREQVELIIHFLCPFAQRALYTSAFKELDVTITEVDLVQKADWFLAVNPQGKVPSAKVTRADGKQVNLFESLTISHYFGTFPGRPLYPTEADGSILPSTIAVADAQAQYISGKLFSYNVLYKPNPPQDQIDSFKSSIREVNAIIGNGYLLDSIFGPSGVTFTDIMVLPFIERLVAYKDTFLSFIWEGEDFTNILNYYNKIFEQPWALKYKANTNYLNKLIEISHLGKLKGLKLPLNRLESVEAYES